MLAFAVTQVTNRFHVTQVGGEAEAAQDVEDTEDEDEEGNEDADEEANEDEDEEGKENEDREVEEAKAGENATSGWIEEYPQPALQ